MRINLSPLLAAALLAGCGPIVQVGGNAPPPNALLTLTATAPASTPVGHSAIDMTTAISVLTPATPGALQTVRIPVMVTDTSIQYVTGAQWSEQPARLFRRLVSDNLSNAGIPVVHPRASGTMGKRIITGTLQDFGVDTREGAPVARVRYDVTLSTPQGLRQRHFERTAPMARVDGQNAAVALNSASNAIAADIVQWLQQMPATPLTSAP